ncbi:RNA polymerase primary sigma factor [Hathewaya proteolytica DSM 3090]|uniref:RNA polymerase primary sigma factor n=1 Tax=Hathewaya proteolytica DSM 3090 TaxID=1121331 RepID=A0A1M6NUT3_9CLOT|nr:sigma-70 family RNA polymerase sigma factor [Hathewaya proteolytica]SHJ99487.1 RNA polymerase primary sigma factor [Hathewaya proteolytica DSM 3090]
MTNEELVKQYQEGDKQALETLIDNNTGLVYKIAKNFYTEKTNSIDYEDLVQEGYLGLMKAAEMYKCDYDGRASFSTYAFQWIFQKIHRFLEQKNTNDEVSLNAPAYANDEEGCNTELMSCLDDVNYDYENVEEQVFMREIRDNIHECMNEYLSLKQRQILDLSYGIDGVRPMIDKDIGDLFGVSGSNIQAIRKYSLRKLKNSKWGMNEGRKLYEQL